MSDTAYDNCKFKMVEIYGGKDDVWEGWHNLLLITGENPEDHKCLAGPVDPQTSKEIKIAINCQNKARLAKEVGNKNG